METKDIERLGKLMGLLGSNHDGERAAAALKATQFLETKGMRWSDVIDLLMGGGRERVRVIYESVIPDHQEMAQYCLDGEFAWRSHEEKFLKQIALQLRNPSDKQMEWLRGLVDRKNRSGTP